MRVSINRAFICVIVVAAASIPALGMSNGPGAYNSNDELTVKYGCSCHNNGAPSERAVVMVTGVPLMYEQSESYQLTIRVADSLTLSGGEGNTQAGFCSLLTQLVTSPGRKTKRFVTQRAEPMMFHTLTRILMDHGY